ncbi:MAG: DUF1016 N-terminal domain-containing protein [Capsulimonadaceae bacterium]
MSDDTTPSKQKALGLSFEGLVDRIHCVHKELSTQASRAVNVCLTLRNWLIGYHIAEYELRGGDRATYGDRLLTILSDELTGLGISNCNRRQVYRYLRFYRLYPEIVGTLSPQFKHFLTTSQEPGSIVDTVSPLLSAPPGQLVYDLSYSHLELLVDLTSDDQRAFYQAECIRGNWSVRELKRQIGSLLYERTSLSIDKNKLIEITQEGASKAGRRLEVRDLCVFEFLGLKPKEDIERFIDENLMGRDPDADAGHPVGAQGGGEIQWRLKRSPI